MGGHYIDRKADPHWRCKKRIAELEARVKELEIERGANQEEIVRLKARVAELEAPENRANHKLAAISQERHALRAQRDAQCAETLEVRLLAVARKDENDTLRAKLAEAEKSAERLKSECVQWQEYARSNERKAAATSKAESQLSTLQEKLKVAREALDGLHSAASRVTVLVDATGDLAKATQDRADRFYAALNKASDALAKMGGES